MKNATDRILGRAALCLGFGLIAACCLTAALLLSPGLRAGLGVTGTYLVGWKIDTPDIYSGSRLTIALFARSSCTACQAAKPRLRAFAEMASTAADVRMVVIPTDGWSLDELAYVREIGLDDAALRVVSTSTLKVRIVPTLVVVDKHGRIQFVHEGVPTAREQAAVQDLVKQASR